MSSLALKTPPSGPTQCPTQHPGQPYGKASLYVHITPALLSPLPGITWSLTIQDNLVLLDPRSEILNHLSAQMAIPYWISRGHLTASSVQLVNWSTLEFTLSACPATYWMWLSKFASGHSAVGCNMHRWKHWDSPVCPICHLMEEDTDHVLVCLNTEHTAQWHTLTNTLQQWLDSVHTHPAISHCIITTLHGCSSLLFSSNAWWSCWLVAKAQDQIGFFGFLLGCLSPGWESLRAHYSQ